MTDSTRTPATATTTTTTATLTLNGLGPVDLAVTERGSGPPVLVLHGGAGPGTVVEFAGLLAQAAHARVLTPIHPGFACTGRPDGLNSVARLAQLYVALLEELDLTDVTVIGNSFGGWVAAEMALSGTPRISRVILLGATGIDVPDHPVADLAGRTLQQILQLSYHDASPFQIDPAGMSPSAVQAAAGNRAALQAYVGPRGSDPTLLARLAALTQATLVIWGDSDGIADTAYGHSYCTAIPGAVFEVLTGTGHMPQVETPEQVVTAVTRFLNATPAWEHDHTQNTTAAPADVWAALRDTYTGTPLTGDGDTIIIHGPFAVGTKLSVTPHGADFVVDCLITELVEEQAYAYRSQFNGLYLTSRHTLTPLAGGGTRINHHSIIAGPKAESAGPHLGSRITEDRDQTMRELIAAAANRNANPAS